MGWKQFLFVPQFPALVYICRFRALKKSFRRKYARGRLRDFRFNVEGDFPWVFSLGQFPWPADVVKSWLDCWQTVFSLRVTYTALRRVFEASRLITPAEFRENKQTASSLKVGCLEIQKQIKTYGYKQWVWKEILFQGKKIVSTWIAGFDMTSLKFKQQNCWSSWDFTLMMYKSSWIQIFAPNGFLVLWYTTLEFLSFCVTRHLLDGESCHDGWKSDLFWGTWLSEQFMS